MRRTRIAMPLAAVCLILPGCGGGDEGGADGAEQAVRAAVTDYAAALKAKDFDKTCASFTKQVVDQLEQLAPSSKDGCEAVVEQLAQRDSLAKIPDPPNFESVKVRGDRAEVRIEKAQRPAILVKQSGAWKLDLEAR